MTDAANRALVHSYYLALNAGDFQVLDQLVTPAYRYHAAGLPPNLVVFKQMLQAYRGGFPDLHHSVDQMIAEGDRVVAQVTTQGTHRGTFLGHAPTQRRFKSVGVDIFRVENERLAERWGAFDTLTMLQQLGLYQPVPA